MRRGALAVLLSGTFVQLMSVTVMQLAIPAIRHDLGAGAGAAQLALAGYTLTYACVLITAARTGDRFGCRRVFAAGTALFTLATLAAALSPDPTALVVARLAQGVGSGVVAPQILSIIQVAVPPGQRPGALGRYGATMAAASLTGPLVSGALLQLDPFAAGWRVALALPVPVGAAALAWVRLLPPDRPRTAAAGVAGRGDVGGAVLASVGMALLVVPLTLGRDGGWPWWGWLGPAGALAGFVAVQRRVRSPVVHPAVFAVPAVRWGLGVVLVFNAGVPSFTLLLSLYLQGERH